MTRHRPATYRRHPGGGRDAGGSLRSLALAAVPLAAACIVVLEPVPASAAWGESGTGVGEATATFVHRAGAPSAAWVGSSVRLDWPAVSLGDGTPVTEYTVLRHPERSGKGGPTQVCTTVEPTRTCVDSAPESAGRYGVVARFRSWTGQESPLTVPDADETPPVTALTSSPTSNAAGWNNTSVTITLTATDDTSGVSSITYRIGTDAPTTVSGSSTSFQISADGETTVSYYATDAAGNAEAARQHTTRIDTSSPTSPTISAISNDSGAVGDRVTNVGTQVLSGAAEPGATVSMSRDGTALPPTTANQDGTYSVPVRLVEGGNTFTATATDAAGNSSAASQTFSVTLDTGLPTLAITDPKGGVTYRNNAGPAATRWGNTCAGSPGACGTAADTGSGVAAVAMRLRDTTTNTCWTGSGTTYAACGSSLGVTGTTAWSRSITYSVVAGRSLQLSVTVTDVAGNVRTGNVTFTAQ